MKFSDIIKDALILRALDDLGFSEPTPIQQMAIPEVLKGHDLRGSAQTGTGKTAAFILPMLSHLLKTDPYKADKVEKSEDRNEKSDRPPFDRKDKNSFRKTPKATPRVLILLPTRELAMQVATETKKLSRHVPHIKTICLYGGVPYPLQNRELSRRVDIMIATPGRLIDHVENQRIDLSTVEILILDEADRMLDMGFIEPVEYIAEATSENRQTLMFSATYGKKVVKLAEKLLKNPVDVKIETATENHESIEQHLHLANNLHHKFELLETTLSEASINQAIVFSSTKSQTENISDHLREKGFKSGFLHGDLNQRQRTRTMQQLREGKIQVLVATDVAARGIDVQTITHVINFDLPQMIDDYIHRIGRTGRAGSKGFAHSFVSTKDKALLQILEKKMGLTNPFPSSSSDGKRGDRSERGGERRGGGRSQSFRGRGNGGGYGGGRSSFGNSEGGQGSGNRGGYSQEGGNRGSYGQEGNTSRGSYRSRNENQEGGASRGGFRGGDGQDSGASRGGYRGGNDNQGSRGGYQNRHEGRGSFGVSNSEGGKGDSGNKGGRKFFRSSK